MPNRLILELDGSAPIEVPIKGTVSQIRGAVKRHAESVGIDLTGMTARQVGEAVLRDFLRSVRDASMAKQRTQAYADLAASIETQLAAENDLFDEPEPPQKLP